MSLPLGQDLGGLLCMSLLIQTPRVIPLRRFPSADDLLGLSRRVPPVQRQPVEDKDGFDSVLFQGSKVGFDMSGQGDGESTGRSYQWFSGGFRSQDLTEILRDVDPDPRVGQSRQWCLLDQSTLVEQGYGTMGRCIVDHVSRAELTTASRSGGCVGTSPTGSDKGLTF